MIEIEKILREKGVKYRLISLAGRVRNHEDANPENDCKTIITKDEKGKYYAFFLRGMMKMDFSKLKNIAKKIRIINTEELKKLTGKEPGEVCPFLLKNIKIYVDKRVFQRDKIHFGSGDSKYGLEIFSKNLNNIINFKIIDIAKESIKEKSVRSQQN